MADNERIPTQPPYEGEIPKMGRPTKYEPRFCALVVEDMAKGYSLGAFAGLIGVDRSTINEWIANYPEFSQAVKEGKALRLRQWETANMKGGFTKDGGNPTLIIFGLKNAGADEWVDRAEVTYSGAVGTYDLSKLSDDELKSTIEVLKRASTNVGAAGGAGEKREE